MEITKTSNTGFKIKGKKTTILMNPEKEAGKLQGEIVITTLGDKTAQVEGVHRTFDWPGEYECKGVAIMGLPAWTKNFKESDESGEGEETVIFCFVIDEIKVCHLGELGHTLSSDMVNKIGDVDVLMIDTGKSSNLSAKKAIEVVEAIEPKALIIMGEEGASDINKELGADKEESLDKFTLSSAADLPVDKRTLVVLNKSK